MWIQMLKFLVLHLVMDVYLPNLPHLLEDPSHPGRTTAGSSRGKASSMCAFLLIAVGRVTSLDGTNGATATAGGLFSTRTRLWSVLEHPFQYKCQTNNRWVHLTSPVTIKWSQQGRLLGFLCFLKAQLQEGWYDLHIFPPKSVKRCAPS